VAYSPHLNGEKLTQREGAIAQYDLAEAHAARIKETAPKLFQDLRRLPKFSQLLERLTPQKFSERLHELVTNNLRGFLTEEEDLLAKTSDVWELHPPDRREELRLIAKACYGDYNHAKLQQLYAATERPDVLKYHRNINGLVIPIGGRWMSTTPQEVLDAIATEAPLAPSRYLKTPEQLQAIYKAAREGEPLIQQVQRVTENRQEAEEALNALLNPAE
jgi:hypothetical protein